MSNCLLYTENQFCDRSQVFSYFVFQFPQPMELSKVVDSLSPYRILKAQDVIEEDIKAKVHSFFSWSP